MSMSRTRNLLQSSSTSLKLGRSAAAQGHKGRHLGEGADSGCVSCSCRPASLRSASSSTGGPVVPCSCGGKRHTTSCAASCQCRASSSSSSCTLACASASRTGCQSASSAPWCPSPCSPPRSGPIPMNRTQPACARHALSLVTELGTSPGKA